jgi:hypothetical protein
LGAEIATLFCHSASSSGPQRYSESKTVCHLQLALTSMAARLFTYPVPELTLFLGDDAMANVH